MYSIIYSLPKKNAYESGYILTYNTKIRIKLKRILSCKRT